MRVTKIDRPVDGKSPYAVARSDGRCDPDAEAFLDFLTVRMLSPNTVRAYAYDVLKLLRFLEMRELSVQDFSSPLSVEFLQWLRTQSSKRKVQRFGVGVVADSGGRMLSARTCNRVLAGISTFYEFLITAGRYEAPENPLVKRLDTAAMRVPTRYRPPLSTSSRQRPVRRVLRLKTTDPLPRSISDESYLKLLEQMSRLRDRALVELMWEGGLRPGEVLGIQFEDVEYGHRRVAVRTRNTHPAGVRQKSRRDRFVDLYEERGLPALNRYVMLERPRDVESHYIFLVGGNGKRRAEPLSYDGLFRMFSRASARAGVRSPWLTPHSLRHTHATRMTELGMRELTLSARLGHASPESTRVYTRVSDHDVVQDYRSALLGGLG
ncbi:tyrosine-type recombinase/integrase [Mycobacteroides abscessus]